VSRRVLFASSARRDLRKLGHETATRVLVAIRRYAETEQGDVVKLTDVSPPQWRLRVGDHRVRFRVKGDALEVLHVLPRGRAYR